MVILDTDAISFLEFKESNRSKELQRFLTVLSADHEIVTTIITYEEQTRGWFKKMSQSRTIEDKINAYGRLNKHLHNYRDIEVLDFDRVAAIEFQKLRLLRLRIGAADLKIASIAIANNALLLSRNLRDFGPIPNLQVKDWTEQR
jgi:tRNA(fMet)-specific endonuclease VapC